MARSELKTVIVVTLALMSIASWVTWEIATAAAFRAEQRARDMLEKAYRLELRAVYQLNECQYALLEMYMFPAKWRNR
jgi:hypothetical protein